MKRMFRRMNWKGILSAVLTCAVLIGVVAGVAVVFGSETKTISAGQFSVGGLDDSGKFVSTNQSIVTKDAFECIGLRIEQDFDSNATYDVYYYDYNGHFVESKLGLSGIYDEDYPLAQLARIVIHPEITADVDPDDFKIRFWETRQYANDLKITVNKDQDYKYESGDLALRANVRDASVGEVDGRFASANNEDYCCAEILGVEYKHYDVYIFIPEGFDYLVGIGANNNSNETVYSTVVSTADCQPDTWLKLELTIKNLDLVEGLVINMPFDAEFFVYGYN